MEYTVKKLAEIAGVSTRTLRYYDSIGLLKPCRVNSAGYRIYGEKEVDLLQQILFYRGMDMKLEDIQQIIMKPDFNIFRALEEHHQRLISQRNQLDQLILTVEKTIAYSKGEIVMSDKEKFQGFLKERVEENEKKYGKEIRERYSAQVVEASNRKFLNMNKEEFDQMTTIENEMFDSLRSVIQSKDYDSAEARNVYEKHKAWLCFYWTEYTKEAHIGVTQMYTLDERFAKYYNDRAGQEATAVLHGIVQKYAK